MIHNIKFRAFVYENESVDEISEAILNILPEAEIEAEEAEGLLENKEAEGPNDIDEGCQ